jgi:hypothetical protein
VLAAPTASALVAVDPASAPCHREDPEAAPFDLSVSSLFVETEACPGGGQCEDQLDERSQNEVPGGPGAFADSLGRDMDVPGPASGDVRASTSASWVYEQQQFGEESGDSLASGVLEIAVLVELVVPEGPRAASGFAAARGCFCFTVSELPVTFDVAVTASQTLAGLPGAEPIAIDVLLPILGSLRLEPGTFDPEPQQLDPGSYCISAETGTHDGSVGNDGASHDVEEATQVAIAYTIIPAPEAARTTQVLALIAVMGLRSGSRSRT